MRQLIWNTYFRILYFLGVNGPSLKRAIHPDYTIETHAEWNALEKGYWWGEVSKKKDEWTWHSKFLANKHFYSGYGMCLKAKAILKIRESDGKKLKVTSNTIRTNNYNFTHGHYKLTAKVHDIFGSWNAFWLFTNQEQKPGEIDIFEYYNKANEEHFDTTIHYGNYPDGKSEKRTRSIKGLAKTNELIEFDMIYKPNSIKIYYDRRLVRVFVDKKVLKVLNNTTFDVIFNTGYTKEGSLITKKEPKMCLDAFQYEKF